MKTYQNRSLTSSTIKHIKTEQVQLLNILKQNMYNYETYKKHIKTEHKYVQLLNI